MWRFLFFEIKTMIMAFLKPRDVFRVYVFRALIAFGNTCGPTKYKSSKGECCPMCNMGSVVFRDCIGDFSTTCIPCPKGTFMNKPSSFYTCFTCRDCGQRQGLYIQSHCTRIKDTICDVLDGYHCVESSNSQCRLAQKHSVCQPGQETKTAGTKNSDTICADCPPGFYSSSGLNCTRWIDCSAKSQVENEAGSSVKDVTCMKKRHGRYGLMVAGTAALIAFISCFVFLYLKIRLKSQLPKHPIEETNLDGCPSTVHQIPEENREEENITAIISSPNMEAYTSTDQRQLAFASHHFFQHEVVKLIQTQG